MLGVSEEAINSPQICHGHGSRSRTLGDSGRHETLVGTASANAPIPGKNAKGMTDFATRAAPNRNGGTRRPYPKWRFSNESHRNEPAQAPPSDSALDLGVKVEERVDAQPKLRLDLLPRSFQNMHGDMRFVAILQRNRSLAYTCYLIGGQQPHSIDQRQICHKSLFHQSRSPHRVPPQAVPHAQGMNPFAFAAHLH
jgi:hypothetical protein